MILTTLTTMTCIVVVAQTCMQRTFNIDVQAITFATTQVGQLIRAHIKHNHIGTVVSKTVWTGCLVLQNELGILRNLFQNYNLF